MTRLRLLLLVPCLAGCVGYVSQTRADATGGEYRVYATDYFALSNAFRSALGRISDACHGQYEIVSLDARPDFDSGRGTSLFLAPDGSVLEGMYNTWISYACGAPSDTRMNTMLQAFAQGEPVDPETGRPPDQAALKAADCALAAQIGCISMRCLSCTEARP